MFFSLGVLKYVGVRNMMNVVFSVCTVTRHGVLVYGKYECYVMQMLYISVHHVSVLNAAFCMTWDGCGWVI